MAKKLPIIAPSQSSGFLQDLILRVKLVWRLMTDRRVNFFLKLLPIASLVYLISPVDLFPGLILPIIGALDDAAVIWIGTSLFVNFCPDDVVQEHMNILQKVIPGTWRDVEEKTDIVEVTPHDASEDEQTQ